MQVFRASSDLYRNSTNYSDLPEIIKSAQKGQSGQSGDAMSREEQPRGTLDQTNLLKHELLYNEEMQVKLFKLKNVKPFKQPLAKFNANSLKMKQRKLPSIAKMFTSSDEE